MLSIKFCINLISTVHSALAERLSEWLLKIAFLSIAVFSLVAAPTPAHAFGFDPSPRFSAPYGSVSGVRYIDVTFDQTVTGFNSSDLITVGGGWSSVSGSGANYRITITPQLNRTGTNYVILKSYSVQGVFGSYNSYDAHSQSMYYDTIKPIATFGSVSGPINGNQTLPITFSQSVTGFNGNDLTVTNGYATLSGSGQSYVATLTPYANVHGDMQVTLRANAATDNIGNFNSATLHKNVSVDTRNPSLSITSDLTAVNTGVRLTVFQFSEPVYDFTTADLTVTNGTASISAHTTSRYTVTFTPTQNTTGRLSYLFKANSVRDGANNTSIAAYQSGLTAFDTQPPSYTFSPFVYSSGSGWVSTVVFSEATYNFTASDIYASTGNVFVSGSGTTYTVILSPPANTEGTIRAYLRSGSVHDAKHNFIQGNSETFQVSYDEHAPELTLVTAVSTPTFSNTPSFVLRSSDPGTISYTGLCSSATTSIAANSNTTIVLNGLSSGYYGTGTGADCTLKVTDAAGNVSSELAHPLFLINTVPVASAGPNRVNYPSGSNISLDGSGSNDAEGSIASYAWTRTGGTGGAVTLKDPTASRPSFVADTLQFGDAGVTYTFALVVTDDAGAVSAADDVFVSIRAPLDTTPPVITAPADIAKKTDAGKQSASISFAATVADNLGATISPVYKLDGTVITSPHVFAAGVHTVTEDADDSAANSATQVSFKVTITQNIPVITGLAPGTGLEAGAAASIDIYGTGFESGATVSYGPSGTGFTCTNPYAPVASIIRCTMGSSSPAGHNYFIVRNPSGYSSPVSSASIFLAAPNVAPSAHAGADQTNAQSGATISLDGSASSDGDGDIASYAWTRIGGTGGAVTLSNAAAQKPTFTADTLLGNTLPVTHIFRLVVTDDDGATSTADTVTITVEPPVTFTLSLPVSVTVPVGANGLAQLTLDSLGAVTVFDAGVGISSLTISPSSLNCSHIGSVVSIEPIVKIVDDSPAGYSTSAVTTAVVVDQIPPTITLTDPVTVALNNAGQASVTFDQIHDTTTDNCGVVASVSMTSSGSFTAANLGANTVSVTATDNTGNSATKTTTVNVVDNVDPVLVLSPNFPSYAYANNLPDAADLIGDSTDNVAVASLTVSPSNFAETDAGPGRTVTLTVTDTSGNTASTTRQINIIESTAPVITVPADRTLDTDAGQPTALVDLGATVTDNSGEVITPDYFLNDVPITSPHAFGPGIHTVEVDATDYSGNTTSDHNSTSSAQALRSPL